MTIGHFLPRGNFAFDEPRWKFTVKFVPDMLTPLSW